MIFTSPSRTAAAAAAAAVALLASHASAQTYTACNPTTQTCSPDTALGMAINVDFTQGEVNSFTSSGGTPTYGSDGVTFTVAKSGDAPQLNSVFYIMFGHVEITMKTAPGTGIVSSFVMQSDDLDEIDMEWLGVDGSQVQTNYFGKGQTTTYDRGQFNPAAGSQGGFLTYAVDWTANRVVWSVGGAAVRTLEYADAGGQYPQTPMQIKFGVWAGGDPSNSAGTIAWAGGDTDYSDGPFSMVVRSIAVTDYSTGSKYSYGDTSGTWQSIVSTGGEINANADEAPTVTQISGSSSSLSPSIPVGGIAEGSSSATQTGWPWVSTSTSGSSVDAIPSGWRMTSSGKIVPASSTAELPTPSSSPDPSASSSSGPGPAATYTTFDGKGFPTTITVAPGTTTTYDGQGSPVATAAPPVAGQQDSSSSSTQVGSKAASSNAVASTPRGGGGLLGLQLASLSLLGMSLVFVLGF